jgi:prolyl 4-hydroxylase
MNVHNKIPYIATINNFITDDECDHIINLAKPHLMRSLVSSNNGGILSEGRTSKTTWINHSTDNITKNVINKICNLVNKPIETAESFQVIYYDINQEYRPHYDGWDHVYDNEKNVRCLKSGGQRILTVLCYLNNVEQGGSTSFPKLNIDIKPEKGKLVIFENVYTNTNIKHELSLHAGTPVIKGEKYAFNLWFREMNRKTVPDYISNLV